ncbi:hypothetical protein [Brevibacillus reuszeri]|uniref:hypothetical protein n=1 Tax=Brevibacillus reuszeri TaxID=54915 RepID=UPI000CCC8096|nr:hypothetical protein [Brevibacillus reuszeri]
MSSATTRKVTKLLNGGPIGTLTPTSGRMARDEAGRVYEYKSMEQKDVERRRKYAERDQRHFSFSDMRNMREITESLSNKYCGYVLLLQPYIAFKSGLLVHNGRDGKPLKAADFAAIWNVSKRTANVVLDELEAHSIVFGGTNGTYTLSDRYHFRKKAGDEVDALIKTFFTTLRRVRLTAADLGILYKLLPYVHLDTNVICSDPFAENPEDVRYLNEKHIAGVLDMSADKTRAAMKRLRKAGVTGEWTKEYDDRETLTVLNPYVFYRKSGEPDGTLRTLFAAQRFETT